MDLQEALAMNIPPIALVDTVELPYYQGFSTPHAVVITGIEENILFLNDPDQPHAPSLASIGDFLLAWDLMANRYALLKP